MIDRVVIIFLTFFTSLFSFSQESQSYVGVIKLSDTTLISYKVSFQLDGEKVKGYSISDLGGDNETRSNIFGEYNKEKKTLDFREVGIVYTKSVVSRDSFCNINARIKLFAFGKTNKIKTNFIGLFPDHTPCIDGELLLSAQAKVESRIDKIEDKLNKSKRVPDSIKQRLNLHKMVDSLQMNILKKDQILSLFSTSKMVKFTIYDGGKEDGDRISIFANGTPVLSNYEASNEKKVFTVQIVSDKTTIMIKALNEGLIAPNTVIVEIEDDNNIIKALSNLKAKELTKIDIIKQ